MGSVNNQGLYCRLICSAICIRVITAIPNISYPCFLAIEPELRKRCCLLRYQPGPHGSDIPSNKSAYRPKTMFDGSANSNVQIERQDETKCAPTGTDFGV